MAARTAAIMIVAFFSVGLRIYAQTPMRDSLPISATSMEQTRESTSKEAIRFPSLSERLRVLSVLVVGVGGIAVLVDQLRRRSDRITRD